MAQTAVLHRIEPILEQEFEDCSYAYRKGRSVRQAVQQIMELYELGYQWVADADIDDFFNQVEHELLLEKRRRHIDDSGILQGSPVSPVLANLFLDELDEAMLRSGFAYVRYADDFLILGKNPAEARQALQLSVEVLERLDLELDEEDIVSFDQGFKYLGVLFLKSMVMQPIAKPKKTAPFFDLDGYLQNKRAGKG